MWAEKSRERLEMRRSRPLNTVDWLGVLIDGVWLTGKICVVVAIGIDTAGVKQALDFEQGTPENITVAADLIERLAARGVEAKGRRLPVGWRAACYGTKRSSTRPVTPRIAPGWRPRRERSNLNLVFHPPSNHSVRNRSPLDLNDLRDIPVKIRVIRGQATTICQ